MATRLRSPRIVFVFVLISLSSSLAWRSYTLMLTDVKCIFNYNYILNGSCVIDKSPPFPRLNLDVQMRKEVKDHRFDFSAEMDRPERDSVTVINVTALEFCKVFAKNLTNPMLRMFKDKLLIGGKMPDMCPLPADYHFHYQNLSLEPEYLPAFVPQTKFKIMIYMKDKQIGVWKTTARGRVVNKKTNKRHRNF